MIDQIERKLPLAAAIAVLAALVYWRDIMVARYVAGDIDFASLYSAVLDWSAIQTGFLFGIFGFVAGKNDGFIAALRNTEELRLFYRYMKTAIFLGFTVTLISIPMMVVNYSIASGSEWIYAGFVFWAFISIWSFFSFARVAYVFGIIVRTKDKTRIPG